MATSSGHASLLGTTFAGYHVLGLIGRGAMGAVYLAHDLNLKRPVALKVLLGSLAHNPVMVKSFQREAQAAAPLRHPNIVRMYNAGLEQGTPFIAMEYVEGEPLDRFLRRQGKIPWQTALFIGEQVADALDCAHGNGIIHRDVKPANILLDKEGHVRLTDFGIANMQSKDKAPSGSRGFMGTPHYMSPEQCSGAILTPASDLFSLGVMMYRLISGRLPFEAESPMELIQKINTVDPPRLNRIIPDVPDDVARLVAHLMQKRPEARPLDARAVREGIKRLIAEQGGRSALPAALSAFIREESDVRTIKRIDGGKTALTLADSRNTGGVASWFKRYGRSIAITASIIACAAASTGAALALREPPAPLPAPSTMFATFSPVSTGLRMARIASDAFRVADLEFIGRENEVLVTLQGKPGSLMEDSVGVMAVDVDGETTCSVRPPIGPATDGANWNQVVPTRPAFSIPPMPVGTPLYNALLVPAYKGKPGAGPKTIVYRPQAWNTSGPRNEVLLTLSSQSWDPPAPVPGNAPRIGYVIPKPDGKTICLIAYDPQSGTNYLAERDVTWSDPGRLSDPLTGPGDEIDPLSVQYSADGRFITYMRITGPARRELWVVPSGAGFVNGTPIAVGDFASHAAFSPNGQTMLIAVKSKPGSAPELRILSTRDGKVKATLGSGFPGKAPWHPAGDYVLVRDSAPPQNLPQLWAVETTEPYRRVQLTQADAGVDDGCVVSEDGHWAVVATMSTFPDILILDLNTVRFDAALPPDDGSSSPGAVAS